MPSPKKKLDLKSLVVTDSRPLTPNMIRLQLLGDAVADFPPNSVGGYIKFAFDANGNPVTDTDSEEKLTLRSYTIRSLDNLRKCVSVDMALHGKDGRHDGPASAFARAAKPGDRISITGPGNVKSLNPSSDWYLIVGDMTALPAISAKLEELAALGEPIRGHLIVEVLDAADALCLPVFDDLEVTVITNPDPAKNTDALINSVRKIPWRDGAPFVWCASEFSRMRDVRQYVRAERGVGLEDRYISSYWMYGRTDEGHKAEKRLDAEKNPVVA